MEATVSPKVERKMVYCGANTASFQSASKDLKELAELEIKPERVRRATLRSGHARCKLACLIAEAFVAKSIPDRRDGPANSRPPELAVVMSDGGRYQRFDRSLKQTENPESFWKESRVGVLLSMKPRSHSEDPVPELPDFLKDVSIAKKLSAIGKVAGENPDSTSEATSTDPPWEHPDLLSKDVVASGKSWKEFGPQLASTAWHAGFYKSVHRVFVSDGSSAIEGMQAEWFSGFTSILDLMHALSYCLAAARALSSNSEESWAYYLRFATAIWEGRVADVISELLEHQRRLGLPITGVSENDPREIVRQAIVYYQNHGHRMKYPEYRKKGYPLTSSLMESTVKQINKRVKGSEKFWSTNGSEALLRLRADYLSDSRPMDEHWKNVQNLANGCRNYTQAT